MRSLAIRHAAASVALAAMFAACSHKSRCVTDGVDVQIAGDHPHSAAVPTDHVKRGAGRTYSVRGSDHEHAFVLRDDDMQKLERGESVTTRTSSVNGHVHEVVVRCKE
jgi:hypothetical protein